MLANLGRTLFRMLTQNPRSVQKRIGNFHPNQIVCAFRDQSIRSKLRQLQNAQNDDNAMMKDNARIKKMLPIGTPNQINHHGCHNEHHTPRQIKKRQQTASQAHQRADDAPLEFIVQIAFVKLLGRCHWKKK